MNREIGLSYKQIKTYAQEKVDEIKSGKFAREWELERQRGYIVFKKVHEESENSVIIKKEQKLLRRLDKVNE